MPKQKIWGIDTPRRVFEEKHWNEPSKWNRRAAKNRERHRVFCASMADVFEKHPGIVDERKRLWFLIQGTPHLDWLILTKRIGNAAAMLPKDWGVGYPNVWLGQTIVNQEEADRDITKLLATPARVRFLSCEPLLGPIDLHGDWGAYQDGNDSPLRKRWIDGLNWVIVGGESGPNARPSNPEWFRSLRDQCQAAGTPFLFKQIGQWITPGHPEFGQLPDGRIAWMDSAGRFLDPPPADENADCMTIKFVSKKRAGRLLDGVEHNEYPR